MENNYEEIAIVLDTNIFGQPSKYNFIEGKTPIFLSHLSGISNIKLFIPNIVVEELKKHIREAVTVDQKMQKSEYTKRAIPDDFWENVINSNYRYLEEMISKNKIEIINCNEFLNINDINNWYFNCIAPFEEKQEKRKEFPDAMIISGTINFLKTQNFDKVYIIAKDKGLRKGFEQNSEYKTYDNINVVMQEILDFDVDDIIKIKQYLKINKILNNPENYKIESYSISDVKEIDDININIDFIDITRNTKNYVDAYATFCATLYGNFYLLDPYNSILDSKNPECSYYELRKSNQINIEDCFVEIKLMKNENGEYTDCEVVDMDEIDLTDYLDQMDLY